MESWLAAEAQLSRVVNAIADLASRMPVLQAVADALQGELVQEILVFLWVSAHVHQLMTR